MNVAVFDKHMSPVGQDYFQVGPLAQMKINGGLSASVPARASALLEAKEELENRDSRDDAAGDIPSALIHGSEHYGWGGGLSKPAFGFVVFVVVATSTS
ncbi:MAG: hypothetical protein ACYC8W_11790 [Candidatus Tyrphobacter sp.]